VNQQEESRLENICLISRYPRETRDILGPRKRCAISAPVITVIGKSAQECGVAVQ
jgi:hypothetical protein